MRWPWQPKPIALIEIPDDADPEDSSDALRRAKAALRKAETDSEKMRKIAGSINRERQKNHFSDALLRSMRRKES